MRQLINVLSFLVVVIAAQGSVLVERYALPPPSFQNIPRDSRSLASATRTLQRLAGGHLRLDPAKNSADYGKNSFSSVSKKETYDEKFIGVDVEAQTLGWNQGQWDDGMLMSSAGDGKDKKKKPAEDDEDKKTLADQVAEGKYGLIQKELFVKNPSRPGVISYSSNPETMAKDNEGSLGGLKKDEVWLAEDHLLVLRGGSFPDKHNAQSDVWPAIDDYKAPPRQVKIPSNPEVPPPFPVRLTDGGPLVFLTPNGSIPAPLFPALASSAGHGAVPHAPFPFPPPGSPFFANPDQRNFTAGQPPFPFAPFPFLPPREGPLPPPKGFNGSFSFPPPPPGNLTDLYDEDDPSVYYPPPYSFMYRADNTSRVPAGPLVPGIVLPPPPDFFGPLNQTTSRPTGHAYPASNAVPITTPVTHLRPTSTVAPVSDTSDNSIDITSTPIPPPKHIKFSPRPIKVPEKVVIIPRPSPKKTYSTTPPTIARPVKTEKERPAITVLQKPVKTTLKPVPVSVGGLYEYNNPNYYETNSVAPSPQPFLIYGPPENTKLKPAYVTSTPVPLKTYYTEANYQEPLPQIQVAKQNTRIRPEFIKSSGQNGKSVASFYFYEEPLQKAVSPAPSAGDYYDGRDYYQSVNEDAVQDGYLYNPPVQGGFTPSNNYDLRPIVPSREPSPFFFIPQRQGSRTLTQEYFSIQKPKPSYVPQAVPVQTSRPESFYDHIANIQQTIDYYTTHRPKVAKYSHNPYREVRQKVTPRPVYQFSFESNGIKQEKSTFRAPKMDNEPFRPMVSYSVPYNIGSEPSTAGKHNYADATRMSTELPQPSKYFTTARPEDYDYEDVPKEHKNIVERTTKTPSRFNAVTQSTVQKHNVGNYQEATTKNPNHAYYTKQEEGLFDDITKNYFTIFGQKIENGNNDNSGIAVTAPLKPEISTVKTPSSKHIKEYPKNRPVKIGYQSQGLYSTVRPVEQFINLENDTRINYINPPPINPDSEFIPIVNPVLEQEYRAKQQQWQQSQNIQRPDNNVEIIKSELIEQQPVKEEQLEYYRPVVHKQIPQQINYPTRDNNPIRYNYRGPVAEGRPGSLIAYRLPGDGAHFYFLTPQPVNSQNYKYRSDSLLK